MIEDLTPSTRDSRMRDPIEERKAVPFELHIHANVPPEHMGAVQRLTAYLIEKVGSMAVSEIDVEGSFQNTGDSSQTLLDKIERDILRANRERQIAESPLDGRRGEVAALICEGLTNAEIAAELLIAEATVKGYVGEIISILRVRNRVGVVMKLLGSP